MPFYAGKEELSNQEIANAWKEREKKLRQWCIERATELFAEKVTTKRYKVDYDYEEEYDSDFFVLSEQEVQEYRDFIAQERKNFEAECPEDIQDENAFNDWMQDAWWEADFWKDIIRSGIECTVQVTGVDLNNSINAYRFTGRAFKDENVEEGTKVVRYVDLTDEQYIRLVAAIVEDPTITVGRLFWLHHDIYEAIISYFYNCIEYIPLEGSEYVIFMPEARADAQKILDAHKDDMPRLPEGPFADIARWLAHK